MNNELLTKEYVLTLLKDIQSDIEEGLGFDYESWVSEVKDETHCVVKAVPIQTIHEIISKIDERATCPNPCKEESQDKYDCIQVGMLLAKDIIHECCNDI